VGASAFTDFISKNKKDVILFQLEVALKDAGNDSVKKSEVVNRIAETISRINKAEDFTKQQDYIRQCAQLLKIDEAGMHTLVNKFIRDRISTQERKQPVEDALQREANARQAEATDFDETTFNLLFKDELQEKEVAGMLLEHGTKKWDEFRRVADYIFDEMMDESLLDNKDVVQLMHAFREKYQADPTTAISSFFIYHPDQKISSFAVSLLNFPYDESDHWRKEFSQSTGYSLQLFEQSYEDFMQTIAKDNDSRLIKYLKMDEDRTNEAVESAINYLKLKKIRRMLLENQQDMEKEHTAEEYNVLRQTHEHLKDMEIALAGRIGTVIIK